MLDHALGTLCCHVFHYNGSRYFLWNIIFSSVWTFRYFEDQTETAQNEATVTITKTMDPCLSPSP